LNFFYLSKFFSLSKIPLEIFSISPKMFSEIFLNFFYHKTTKKLTEKEKKMVEGSTVGAVN